MSTAPSLRLDLLQEQANGKTSESYRMRLDKDLIREIKQLADSEERTMHNMMIVLLRRGLRRER